MKKTAILLSLVISSILLNAQSLRFRNDGTFKILQLTDVHWDNASPNCGKTIETIQEVILKEEPDFVVFTGDIVTTNPVKEGWKKLSALVIAAKIPWSFTFGNHDEEQNLSKKAIYDYLQTLPYFIGEEGNVSGVGNFVIPVKDSKIGTQNKAALYLIDSHSYTHNPKLGYYDWVKIDQINWYLRQSNQFTRNNNNQPLPSLAFFHIPLIEYNAVAKDEKKIGFKGEGVASSEINSGLFASFLEQKDMMGVFVGHDHDNNYIGITRNIALAFGQATGADAYGDLERGGRVIVLQENKYAFQTWISTPTVRKHHFYYPSGLPVISDTTKMLKATNIQPQKQGVNYRYYEYEGKIKTADTIVYLPLKSKGEVSNFSIESAKKQDYFAFEYESWLKIPATGYYKFYIYSDDGSKLYIDGQLVVDNDGGHSAKREEGVVALEKGFHKLDLKYFESYMGNVLEVGISGISIRETKIPDNMLFIKK